MRSTSVIPPKKRPAYVTVKFPPSRHKPKSKSFVVYGVPEDEIAECLVHGVTSKYPDALNARETAAAPNN